MNAQISPEFIRGMIVELRAYLALCEEILTLATNENRALAGQTNYEPSEFHQKRTKLLPNIETLLTKLKSRRIVWQQVPLDERESNGEVKSFFQAIQNLLMKILLLDRENQQAMLRRGLVPVKHLPSAAVSVQKPNFVASVYQRNFNSH